MMGINRTCSTVIINFKPLAVTIQNHDFSSSDNDTVVILLAVKIVIILVANC